MSWQPSRNINQRLMRHLQRYTAVSVLFGQGDTTSTPSPSPPPVQRQAELVQHQAETEAEPAGFATEWNAPTQATNVQRRPESPPQPQVTLPGVRPVPARPHTPTNPANPANRPVQPSPGAPAPTVRRTTRTAQPTQAPLVTPPYGQPNGDTLHRYPAEPTARPLNNDTQSVAPPTLPPRPQPTAPQRMQAPPVARAKPVPPVQQPAPHLQPDSVARQTTATPSLPPSQPQLQPQPHLQKSASPAPVRATPPTQRANEAASHSAAQPSTPPTLPQPAPRQQKIIERAAALNPDAVKPPAHLSEGQLWQGLEGIHRFHRQKQTETSEDTAVVKMPWEQPKAPPKPKEPPRRVLRRSRLEEITPPRAKKTTPQTNTPLQRQTHDDANAPTTTTTPTAPASTDPAPVANSASPTNPPLQRDLEPSATVAHNLDISESQISEAAPSVAQHPDRSPISRSTPTDTDAVTAPSPRPSQPTAQPPSNGQQTDPPATSTSVPHTADAPLQRTEAPATTQPEMPTPAKPPLEEAWPVQRMDDSATPSPSADADTTATVQLDNLDPPARELTSKPTAEAVQAETILREVAPAQKSNSSIEFVRPTRPRPNIQRQAQPRQPQATPQDSYPVETEVGTLPSDLWRLVGDTPPEPAPRQQQNIAGHPISRAAMPTPNAPQESQPLQRTEDGPPDQRQSVSAEPTVTRAAEPHVPPHSQTDAPASGAQTRPTAPTTWEQASPVMDSASSSVRRTAQPAQPLDASAPSSRTEMAQMSNSPKVSRAPDAHQPTNQPASQPTIQPASQPTNQPASQPISHQPDVATPNTAVQRGLDQKTATPPAPPQSSPAVPQPRVARASQPVQPPPTPDHYPSPAVTHPAPHPARTETRARVQRAPEDTAVDDDAVEGEREPDMTLDADTPDTPPADDLGPDNSTLPVQVPNNVAPDEMLPPPEEQVTLFLSEALAEESGAEAIPVQLGRQGSEQTATLFGDGEGVEHLLSQASDVGGEQTAVSVFNTSDEAEEQAGSATAVVLKKEESEEAGLAYAPEDPLDTFLVETETSPDNNGLPFYADDSEAQSAEGSITQLRVQRDDDDETYLLYANADQLDNFLDTAEIDEQEGTALIYATEEIAATEDAANPVELVLWPQDSDSKHIVFMDEEQLDLFLAQTETLEIGPNITVFAAESEAAAGGPVVNMLLKRQDDNDVVLGYVEETELEEYLRTAEAYFPEREVGDLTRLVYQRIRHQLQIERERAR